jgi:hypothetical protein
MTVNFLHRLWIFKVKALDKQQDIEYSSKKASFKGYSSKVNLQAKVLPEESTIFSVCSERIFAKKKQLISDKKKSRNSVALYTMNIPVNDLDSGIQKICQFDALLIKEVLMTTSNQLLSPYTVALRLS